ncbi:MAG: thiamine ABC transporter substrate-binding protein [Thermoflexales bacterium]|nr:thiamine ABC transporter substrate-binding protein [Thermoflexales bacterium]
MKSMPVIAALAVLLAACAPATPIAVPPSPPTATPAVRGGTVVVMTHDSFSLGKDTLAAFEKASGIKVSVLKSGDAGASLNKAILTKSAPLADVFFGVDNTLLTRALAAGIFEPYAAPALGRVPARFKLDAQNRLVPVDYGHIAINYDKAWFEGKKLALPAALKDLADPKYKGLLVVENPATSSPGLAFLLATVAAFPEGSAYPWQTFWADLRRNDVKVTEGWEAAYYTEFSGSSGKGARPLVVSYQTSPAAEVMFSDGKLSEPPTGNLDAVAFEQIEFAGILSGAKNRANAEAFIDFLLSDAAQKDVPGQMVVYPVIPGMTLPAEFDKFAPQPRNVVSLPPEQIDKNRETWVEAWTRIVLK